MGIHSDKGTPMIKKISFRFAAQAMVALLVIVLIYHFLILGKVIPYAAVWGGRLTTDEEMYGFESFSIAVNLLMLLVVAIRAGYTRPFLPMALVRFLLWLMVAVYLLNTVGNIFSLNAWEAVIFTPLTLISAVLTLRLAVERQS